MKDIDWQSVAAVATTVVIICGLGFMMLRARLAADFVTRNDYEQMQSRLRGIEAKLSNIPQHADLMALERRVAGVSESTAAINAFVQGLKDDSNRIQHQLNMLIDAKLQEEKVRS